MAFTGQQILDRARYKANDRNASLYSWDDTEALLWINDAQRAIVRALHKAGATAAQPTIANASSRQTMSGLSLTRGIAFIDVVCNVSGSTRGTPIRRARRADLDDEVPAWHNTAGTPEYWVPDERDPLAFYLYPQPASGTNKLEVIYAAPPADLGSLSGTFGLDDIYAEPALHYLLAQFFGKDITKLKSAQYAAQYLQMFYQSLGVQDQSLMRTTQEGNAKEQGA
jgi:hypothetical protein